jgi:plasmid stabilization system protein ParE
LNKYDVKLYARAYQDLDSIYTYIAENLLELGTALNMVDELEKAIFSLEQLPERGTIYAEYFLKLNGKTVKKRAVFFLWKGKAKMF